MADIKIMKRLIALMEENGGDIDLGYFTEAIMWWDEGMFLNLGVVKEIYHNTTFFKTPKNKIAYLYWGGTLYNRGVK